MSEVDNKKDETIVISSNTVASISKFILPQIIDYYNSADRINLETKEKETEKSDKVKPSA